MSVVNNRVALKHLVSMEHLTNEEVLGLISRGSEYKAGKVAIKDNSRHFAANLFFENSTRTHKSFEVAENKLGLRSEEHTSELQSRQYLVCRLLLEKKNTYQ